MTHGFASSAPEHTVRDGCHYFGWVWHAGSAGSQSWPPGPRGGAPGGGAVVARRATGRGSGSVIGGRVMLAVAPASARVLTVGRDVVLVTGTNGKTTTTAYVTAALRTRAIVDTNHTGANTPAGLVSTLASGSA